MGKMYLFADHNPSVYFTVNESFDRFIRYIQVLCMCNTKQTQTPNSGCESWTKQQASIRRSNGPNAQRIDDRTANRFDESTLTNISSLAIHSCIRINKSVMIVGHTPSIKRCVCKRSWNRSDAFLTSANNLLDMQINGPYQMRASIR